MTTQELIFRKVKRAPAGKLFFVSDLGEYNSAYVSKILSLMTSYGDLERLAKGVYYKPIVTSYGTVYPTAEKIVKAIAKRENAKILPTGETALHALGFSTQVPTKPVYLTTGTQRVVKVGTKTITLRRRAPSNLRYKSRLMPVLILALKAKGRDNIGANDIERIRVLWECSDEKEAVMKDLPNAPVWIKMILKPVFKSNNHESVAREER